MLYNAGEVTTEDVKAAFKAQALVLHPDRAFATGKELTVEGQKEAHVQFQRLQMAYDVLRDPEKRRAYDRGQLLN
jgi:DnaJ-class molecular chaperone